jgi:NAD(P)-dependent dehydrogenase (short-subunit alcohol dehydrogenase family)
MQPATNHLGHFLFTGLLLSALRRAPSPRIVNVKSTAFELTPFSFSDFNFLEGKTYNPWIAYGQSKTSNVLFTKGLSLKYKDIQAFVVHPGMVNETGIGNTVDEASWKQAWEIAKEMNVAPPTVKNLQEGCATGLVAALDPALKGELDLFRQITFGNSVDFGET